MNITCHISGPQLQTSVFILLMRKVRNLTANVKDEDNHNTISGALSTSTDEGKRHLPDVCNRVHTYILNRVEQMKTIKQ